MNQKDVRDWIVVGLEIIATAGTVYMLWRLMSGPDAKVAAKMKIAKNIESYAQHRAEFWASVADNASRTYDKCRNVTA